MQKTKTKKYIVQNLIQPHRYIKINDYKRIMMENGWHWVDLHHKTPDELRFAVNEFLINYIHRKHFHIVGLGNEGIGAHIPKFNGIFFYYQQDAFYFKLAS